MNVILIAFGVFVLVSVFIYAHDDRKRERKLLERLSKRQDFTDSLLKQCERESDKGKARIDTLEGSAKKLFGELDFMRAHQHGMDKRIAGIKKEVIVTINGTVPVEPQKPKSLLKRAGVTQ